MKFISENEIKTAPVCNRILEQFYIIMINFITIAVILKVVDTVGVDKIYFSLYGCFRESQQAPNYACREL
jgi:hypothetical protein